MEKTFKKKKQGGSRVIGSPFRNNEDEMANNSIAGRLQSRIGWFDAPSIITTPQPHTILH
jgi:hypothetical protein